MTLHVNSEDAMRSFRDLFAKAKAGEEVWIEDSDGVSVRMVGCTPMHSAVMRSGVRPGGMFEGQIKIASDFDVWPDDIARSLGMRD